MTDILHCCLCPRGFIRPVMGKDRKVAYRVGTPELVRLPDGRMACKVCARGLMKKAVGAG
jgi:hypothetical protein